MIPVPRSARLTLAFEAALPPPVEPSVESDVVLVATSQGGCQARIRYTSDGPTAIVLTRLDNGERLYTDRLPQEERDLLAAWAVEFWKSITGADRPVMLPPEPQPAVRVAPEPRMRRPDGRYRLLRVVESEVVS